VIRCEQGISLFLVEAQAHGLQRRDYPCIDGPRASDLILDDVFVSRGALLGDIGEALPALRYQQGRAIAGQCAEAVGGMQEAFRLTLDYLKTRKQFGTPIGKFQVLQHRMADMCGELEMATSMAILAACVADQADGDERSRQLAAAKFVVVRAAPDRRASDPVARWYRHDLGVQPGPSRQAPGDAGSSIGR
jgi:alkylation response protein AidB-like acyl-CoA dehydrogenase